MKDSVVSEFKTFASMKREDVEDASFGLIKSEQFLVAITTLKEYVYKDIDNVSDKYEYFLSFRSFCERTLEKLKSNQNREDSRGEHIIEIFDLFLSKLIEIMPVEIKSKNNKVDIAIITATQEELDSVILGIPNFLLYEDIDDDASIYYVTTIGKYKIILTRLPFMGMPAAACSTSKLIFRFMPSYIVMVGIAAGNADIAKNIGDILIAEKSLDYNHVVEILRKAPVEKENKIGSENKRTEHDIEFITFTEEKRMQVECNINGTLKTRIEKIAKREDILQKIYAGYTLEKPKDSISCHIGTIITGAAMVRSSEKISHLKKIYHRILGLDMETYAVYYSAENTLRSFSPKFISLKSVSDFGEEKSKSTKVDKKHYACYTSANFLYYCIINDIFSL